MGKINFINSNNKTIMMAAVIHFPPRFDDKLELGFKPPGL